MKNVMLAKFPTVWNIISREYPRYLYIREEDTTCINDPAKMVPKWDRLLERYGPGKGVYIGFEADGRRKEDNTPLWQEVLLGSGNPIVRDTMILSRGNRIDSYTVQAINRGIVDVQDGVVANKVQGILYQDDHFLMALRAGPDQDVGKLNVLPGGGVKWSESYKIDPFTDAFCNETLEEAGTEVSRVRLLGIFNRYGSYNNRQWVYAAVPNRPLDEIIEDHKRGIEHFNKMLAITKDVAYARASLKDIKYPKDAWESLKLLKVPLTKDKLLEIISGDFCIEGYTYNAGMMGSIPGSLYLAGSRFFGKDFETEARKVSSAIIDTLDSR